MKLLSQCDYHSGCARLHCQQGIFIHAKRVFIMIALKRTRNAPLLIVRHRRRLHSHKRVFIRSKERLHSMRSIVFMHAKRAISIPLKEGICLFSNELCGRNGQVCALLISNEGTVCIRSRHHGSPFVERLPQLLRRERTHLPLLIASGYHGL